LRYGISAYCSNGITISHVGGYTYYSGAVNGYSTKIGGVTYYQLDTSVVATPYDPVAQAQYQAAIAEYNRQNFAAGYAISSGWGENFKNWLRLLFPHLCFGAALYRGGPLLTFYPLNHAPVAYG
jgi:hypothetical protein